MESLKDIFAICGVIWSVKLVYAMIQDLADRRADRRYLFAKKNQDSII